MSLCGKCPKCGKFFKRRKGNQLFCNDCMRKAKEKGVHYKRCRICGGIFETSESNHETTCIECKRKRMRQGICPVCGQTFYKKNPFQSFCSECIKSAKVEGYRYRICNKCRKPFKALHEEGVCGECNAKKAKELESKKESAVIKMKKRRCHDCGKPTYNYRCDKCREKWQREHSISLNSSDFDYYTVWS